MRNPFRRAIVKLFLGEGRKTMCVENLKYNSFTNVCYIFISYIWDWCSQKWIVLKSCTEKGLYTHKIKWYTYILYLCMFTHPSTLYCKSNSLYHKTTYGRPAVYRPTQRHPSFICEINHGKNFHIYIIYKRPRIQAFIISPGGRWRRTENLVFIDRPCCLRSLRHPTVSLLLILSSSSYNGRSTRGVAWYDMRSSDTDTVTVVARRRLKRMCANWATWPRSVLVARAVHDNKGWSVCLQ